MNIKKLENTIVKALDQEIDMANNVGLYEDTYYDANLELPHLKRFIQKCFKKHGEGKEQVNPYKDKLKKVLEICKINSKGWDADQHDGKAEFKTICDLIEDKGWYKK